jgi:hypothetical protein
VTYARNRGYLWASLRAVLANSPVLLAQVPDKPGPVDTLPFSPPGVAKVAVRKDTRVLRQRTFGLEEMKAGRPTRRIEKVSANSASERTTISASRATRATCACSMTRGKDMEDMDDGPEEKA